MSLSFPFRTERHQRCVGPGRRRRLLGGLLSVAAAALLAATADEPRQMTDGFVGTVISTTNASRYTYIQVNTGGEEIWAVAPRLDIKPGEKVILPPAVPMKDFHSPTLGRTFDMVYFVSGVTVAGKNHPGAELPIGHPPRQRASAPTPAASGPEPVAVDLSGIEKPVGGKTIAELFAEKTALADTEVVVRGQVVKVNLGIMGRNWVHLRDGTSDAAGTDLTVTTEEEVQVGEIVTARGRLVLDQNFGRGYQYELLLRDATFAGDSSTLPQP